MKVTCSKCDNEQEVPKAKGAFSCSACRGWTKLESDVGEEDIVVGTEDITIEAADENTESSKKKGKKQKWF